jgi:serine/threonine-protein kinase HipA
MSREIFVHMDLKGKAYFVGRLWIHLSKGHERASFEYSSEWRTSPVHFSLEPALEMGEGTFHTDKALFGSIGDSAPDRWGRLLMERREARRARSEKRRARKLHESDYLLMVNDVARQGALRFSENIDGSFLATETDIPIPPIVYLERLLTASDRIQAREEMDEDIRDLVDPGASIGGARPKASVFDNEGNLLIAKFPSRNDDWDVELWEFLSFRMAKRASLSVPEFRLEKILNRNLLLLKRFDRRGQEVRIPFLSAMSMLEASDGDHGSYLDLGEILREYGSSPGEDLENLWRRMVFNIMISNVDDHLRNHGFLYQGTSGWRLSPVYDLEPTPEHKKPRVLHTRIDFYDGTASLELAYEVAEEFGLDPGKARRIAKEVAMAVKDWDKEAIRFGAGKDEVEYMRSAFDHGDLDQALKGKAKAVI